MWGDAGADVASDSDAGIPWGVVHFKPTLPETSMETQKGPHKDYSPFKGGLYGFPCSFGGV